MLWETRILRDIPFEQLERAQAEAAAEVRANPQRGFLIVSEPHPTYTVGISGGPTDLLWDEQLRQRHGIQVARAHRGGKWTYHGPGQIVVYPIFKLDQIFRRTRVRGFLDTFRAAIQKAVNDELRAASSTDYCQPHPTAAETAFGLYVGTPPAKLVSFGVGIRRGITSHGAAVYHRAQSSAAHTPFEGIVPCGISAARYTTLCGLGWKKNWEETSQIFVRQIMQDFETARLKEFASI